MITHFVAISVPSDSASVPVKILTKICQNLKLVECFRTD